jgi:hypothetical protein
LLNSGNPLGLPGKLFYYFLNFYWFNSIQISPLFFYTIM